MPSLKEILILIFVLFSCLIIAFSNSNTDIKTAKKKNTAVIKTQDKPLILSEETKMPENKQNNDSSAKTMTKQENIVNPSPNEVLLTTPVFNATLSLKTILDEVENLSSELKLEFENLQKQKENCSSCGSQSEDLPSSPFICATILSAPGGGGCSCASLGCTPPVGPWCVNPCCCVCCPPCCGG